MSNNGGGETGRQAAGFWRRRASRPQPEAVAHDTAAEPGGFETLFGERMRRPPEAAATGPTLAEAAQADAPVATEADRNTVLRSWAARELAHWRLNPVDPEQAAQSFAQLNATRRRLFLYRFSGQQVELLPKEIAEGEAPVLDRAEHYLRLFRMAAASLPPDYEATLALGLNDKLDFQPDVPVFCFQKRAEERGILLPDIDFLIFQFYEGEHVHDAVRFEDKLDSAVFVGSTTGGEITAEMASDCRLPRLRAARFFHGNRRVLFRLPHIVQTTSEDARAILANLPFCQGDPVPWTEQFKHRFLLSIDGNGATCSRVAIALRSNSALIKYESPDLLYYFGALQPWQHYLPVTNDGDVEKLLDIDAWSPGLVRSVAEQGAAFAAQYLNQQAVLRYTTELLLLYRACFVADTNRTAAPAQADLSVLPASPTSPQLALIAHVEAAGNVQADANGWVGIATAPRRIEGFLVKIQTLRWRDALAYRVAEADGRLGPLTESGVFCGTRGKGRFLAGFVMECRATAPAEELLVYEGIFQDEFRSGWLPAGTVCRSPSGAALVAMRVRIVLRAA